MPAKLKPSSLVSGILVGFAFVVGAATATEVREIYNIWQCTN